jgi:hypothetical protein
VPAVDIAELVPWKEFRLPASPFPGTWGFNATIVRVPDGDHPHAGKWLCNLRCANYHLPGSGAQQNSTGAQNGVSSRIRNRNWILTLDPDSGWSPICDVEVTDRSAYASARGAEGRVLGYEDLRLAWSPTDGLIASATAMLCNTDGVLEIVVLDLDESLQIENVQPLRGPWSERHQKNWMPILGGQNVRWLYSPEDGGIHDRDGRTARTHRRIAIPRNEKSMIAPEHVRAHQATTAFTHGSIGVQLLPTRQRVSPPRQTPLELRGGTQLVPVPELGADRYLGLAHACRVGTTKLYWHHAIVVSASGDLLAISPAMKLSPEHGIEFAAGLARDPGGDGDRLIVTYGVEDDSARLAETSVRALIGTLEAIP